MWEVEGEWQIGAQPRPKEKLTIRQGVRIVKEVPEKYKDPDVEAKADEDKEVRVSLQTARLTRDPGVTGSDGMGTCRDAQTTQDNGRDKRVCKESSKEHGLG